MTRKCVIAKGKDCVNEMLKIEPVFHNDVLWIDQLAFNHLFAT